MSPLGPTKIYNSYFFIIINVMQEVSLEKNYRCNMQDERDKIYSVHANKSHQQLSIITSAY